MRNGPIQAVAPPSGLVRRTYYLRAEQVAEIDEIRRATGDPESVIVRRVLDYGFKHKAKIDEVIAERVG